MTRPPTETASTHTLHPSPTLFRSHRAGRHHRDALHFRLAVERLLRIFGAHVLLAFIEHLDVAAERNRRDLVFGTVAPEPAPQRCAKADREAQYLDPEPACDPEMTEFVEGHQYPEADEQPPNGAEKCLHVQFDSKCVRRWEIGRAND